MLENLWTYQMGRKLFHMLHCKGDDILEKGKTNAANFCKHNLPMHKIMFLLAIFYRYYLLNGTYFDAKQLKTFCIFKFSSHCENQFPIFCNLNNKNSSYQLKQGLCSMSNDLYESNIRFSHSLFGKSYKYYCMQNLNKLSLNHFS